jgi:hypothetical protein
MWCAGFRGSVVGEGFDDAHRAATSGAFLVQALLIGISAPILTGHLIRLATY